MDPTVRPPDLPEPGTTPGGEERRQVGNMFAGQHIGEQVGVIPPPGPLPDDHDAQVGQGIGGPSAGQQRPVQTPQPAIKPGPVRKQHPVLTQLREDLGLDTLRPSDVQVGGHRWTLTMLTPGDVAMAARLAEQLAVGQVERHLVEQAAVVAHAVIAIDQVPTYRVFDVEPAPGAHITNPLRPPRAVRYIAAGKLYDFIQDEGRTELANKLHDAYMDKADGSGAVGSYLDSRVQFRCGVEGCDHTLRIPPRYQPGTRDIVLPFCRWHAEPMGVVELEETVPGPL
jgi:hypothetical protein